MSGVSTTTLVVLGGIMAASAAATATTSNVNAIKARQDAKSAQDASLAAAKAAADKSKGAITSNAGDVSLESTDSLEDADIRSRATKNRLRVNTTGISIGGSSSAVGTGLSI